MNDQFVFCSREWRLFHQCLNEVLRGFRLPNLENVIGMPEQTLLELLNYLDGLESRAEILLERRQVVAFRSALSETLHELGLEEFHTRTGYEFAEGKAILAKLETWLSATAIGR